MALSITSAQSLNISTNVCSTSHVWADIIEGSKTGTHRPAPCQIPTECSNGSEIQGCAQEKYVILNGKTYKLNCPGRDLRDVYPTITVCFISEPSRRGGL